MPHDEKTKTVVLEPFLTEQWYLNVAAAGRQGHRGGGKGRDQIRPRQLDQCLFRLDEEYPALVHFAPALVGPSDSGLV